MSAVWDRTIEDVSRAQRSVFARRAGALDLRAYLDFLRRRAVLIGVVAAAILGLAAASLAIATTRFTASSVLIVDPRQQRVLQSEAVLAGIGADAAAVESQVEVISSTDIARAVIARLGLDQDPELARSSLTERATASLRALLGRDRVPAPGTLPDRVLGRFADDLRVARRGLTYVLEIKFTSEDAQKAARIANAVAAAYLSDQSSAKVAATSEAAGYLGSRLDELRRRVADAERAVATYRAQNNIVETGEGRTLADRQIAELNQQLILVRARAAETKARLEQLGKVTAAAIGAGSVPEALQSPVLVNLRSQYAEAARREAETLATLGPKHPAVASARAQLADTRAQIERELARVTAAIRNEAEVSTSRERSLERSLGEFKEQSGRADQAGVKLRELEREATASRTLLEQSLLRFRETSEQEGLQRPDARVLSPATVPLWPSEPKTAIILIAGLVGGLIAGVGAAGVAESLSRGFRTPEEVEDSLALPVLGHLPLVEAREIGRRGFGRGLSGRDRSAAKARGAASAGRRLARFAIEQPLTPFGEALRAVRTRLSAGREGRSQVLAVLSAIPNEGKSTVAANLAHSFAKTGLTTLLIDVDVRKSGAPRTTGSGFGLVRLLSDAEGGRKPVFQIDPVSGLRMLPLGAMEDVAAASELVTGAPMRALLERLRSQFQVIVLDAPPLLPFVDGRTLLEHADTGLFVVEWNRTDRGTASAALNALGSGIGKIAGALLNKVDPRAQRLYGYDYGYGYG